ncbi:polysaccharide pyruvyl transferase family protein [Butyrivibrio sp. AE3006]|uniref:polysaccharide pyruvyl transferase family protein n=1 Tax=Butyrivibrio sp. AE3006 TaxID=1280673 RepID=UPI00040C51A1|nr:polysaccharide pyruvyl transferase family protein [Butyrivibrio sp. AE3006]
MRIAILSMQRVLNYGSVLQAYSLREIIRELSGESADFLDIKEEPFIEACMPVQDDDDYAQESYFANPLFDKAKKYVMYRIQQFSFFRKIREFWKTELGMTEDTSCKTYDLVFVGSDEVFKCTNRIRKQLYGEVDNAEAIVTYAASCGSAVYEGIPHNHVDDVKKCLSNFKKLSVRDLGTKEYISHLYDGEIEYNLDPVLVGPLPGQVRKTVGLKNYMIVYAYNDRIRSKKEIDAIKNFAKNHGLKTVCCGGVLYWCDLFIPADPFRVLDYFYNAEYIVTDTFHGTIFSVINHKKFVSIIRATNKNKMTNLLADLQLEDRKLEDISKLEDVINKEIDYDKVDSILETERKKSKKYIKECIELAK